MLEITDLERQTKYENLFNEYNVKLLNVQSEWNDKKELFLNVSSCMDFNNQCEFRILDYDLDENSNILSSTFLADIETQLATHFSNSQFVYIVFDIGFKDFFFKTSSKGLISNIKKMEFLLDYQLNINFYSIEEKKFLGIEDDESLGVYFAMWNEIGEIIHVVNKTL